MSKIHTSIPNRNERRNVIHHGIKSGSAIRRGKKYENKYQVLCLPILRPGKGGFGKVTFIFNETTRGGYRGLHTNCNLRIASGRFSNLHLYSRQKIYLELQGFTYGW